MFKFGQKQNRVYSQRYVGIDAIEELGPKLE
jgi:hypothetical protein